MYGRPAPWSISHVRSGNAVPTGTLKQPLVLDRLWERRGRDPLDARGGGLTVGRATASCKTAKQHGRREAISRRPGCGYDPARPELDYTSRPAFFRAARKLRVVQPRGRVFVFRPDLAARALRMCRCARQARSSDRTATRLERKPDRRSPRAMRAKPAPWMQPVSPLGVCAERTTARQGEIRVRIRVPESRIESAILRFSETPARAKEMFENGELPGRRPVTLY